LPPRQTLSAECLNGELLTRISGFRSFETDFPMIGMRLILKQRGYRIIGQLTGTALPDFQMGPFFVLKVVTYWTTIAILKKYDISSRGGLITFYVTAV
jgi:hypothetical protein